MRFTTALKSVFVGTASVVALSLGVSAPALAQLEEITVRATKRETLLQRTPVSVTAIQADAVDTIVARDIGDVAVLVPNFSAAKITGFNAASFAMRGAGQTDIIVYSEPSVGVVIDDFVVPHVQTQLLDIFDIEQVEVLRGPQGTVFGKNTTAGVVSLRTKRPDLQEMGAQASARIASFGRREGRLAVNFPLVTDKLALRFSGLYVNSDGYYRNGAEFGPVTPFVPIPGISGATGQGDNSRLGGEDVFSGRAKLLWEPTDTFSALFQYEIIRDNSDDVPSINETPVGDPRFVFNNLGLTQDVGGDPLDNAASTGRNDQLLNMGDGHQVDVDGFYLNMEWDAGPMTVTSVTGYREQQSRLPSTYTGEVGPVSLFDANRADDRETFQQEIRVAGTIGDRLDMVGGLFYQDNDVVFCVTQVLGFLDLFGLGPPFGTFNNGAQALCNAQDARAAAGFADGTFAVTDRLTIGGGIRYTWEEKEWIGRNQQVYEAILGVGANELTDPLAAADFNLAADDVLSDGEEWAEPSWRATASYQFTDDIFGYFTASRGFKSGAYNDQSGTTGNQLTQAGIAPTNPEFATSYEGGVKTDLFDNTLRLNATFFYVKYSDAQRQIAATLTNAQGVEFQETRFFNAAELNVKGVEVEGSWIAPIEGLTFNGNFSWQDGEFDRFEADTNFDGVIDVDFSGRPLTRTPKFQTAMQMNYVYPVTANLEGLFSVIASYESRNEYNYSDIDPAFDTFLNERTLVDANITLREVEDAYFVRFFVQNLTDKRYRISSQPVANLWTFSQYGAPRVFGGEIGFKF